MFDSFFAPISKTELEAIKARNAAHNAEADKQAAARKATQDKLVALGHDLNVIDENFEDDGEGIETITETAPAAVEVAAPVAPKATTKAAAITSPALRIPAFAPDTCRRGRKPINNPTTNRPVVLEWRIPAGFDDSDLSRITARDIYADRFPGWSINGNVLQIKCSRKPDGTYANAELISALDAELTRW